MIETHALFPTPVMVAKNAVSLPSVDLARTQVMLHLDQVNSHDTQLVHSPILTTTEASFFDPLKTLVERHLVEFGASLFGERLRWHVKEVWVNRLRHGAHQASHVHANSLVSGVIYLTPSHPSANLIFERGQGSGQFIFSNFHAGSDVTPYNAARWQIPSIEAGDLILFPSHLMHGVPRNDGGDRVSISFNAIPERLDAWGYGIQLAPLSRA